MLTIDFLIPTYSGRSAGIEDMLLEPLPGVGYVVCHQGQTSSGDEGEWSRRGDVTYWRFPDEVGLSRNRNRAISLSNAHICALLDDDCRLVDDAVERIRDEYQHHRGASLIIFQTTDHTGVARREYPPPGHRYTRREAFHASSMEITFRREAARWQGLGFDERFGVNARFRFGEDPLFVADAIAAGLSVVQGRGNYAGTILESTGERIHRELARDDLTTLGAIASRKWGKLAPAILAKEAYRLTHSDNPSRYGTWDTLRALDAGRRAVRSVPRRDAGLDEAGWGQVT